MTQYEIRNMSMLDMEYKECIDAVITDPPYELGFMGKSWDNQGIAFRPETWEKCYDALKPGGYLLAFGGTRTFHRIACAIEDAGFEIRDTIMWLYGSGFPKSHNIGLSVDKKLGFPDRGHRIATASRFHPDGTFEPNGEQLEPYEAKTDQAKQWQGWGTALKPAFEPIIVARKPFRTSVAENIMKYGVGGINIDECRVDYIDDNDKNGTRVGFKEGSIDKDYTNIGKGFRTSPLKTNNGFSISGEKGRFPANVIHDGSEEVISGFPSSNKQNGSITKPYKINNQVYGDYGNCNTFEAYQDSGSASRYFYTAKASKKDRDEGLDSFQEQTDKAKGNGLDRVCEFCGASQLTPEKCHCVVKSWITKPRKNIHPTVKPCELMQYLVRLVSPKGATILDPFMGSGSTGKAVMFENRERNANYKFIGIDLEKEYCEIAEARIDYALNKYEYDAEEEKQLAEAKGQLSLF